MQRKLSTRQLTLMGTMIAILIVISYIPAFRIGNYVAIGVGFLGTAFSAIFFGPFYASIIVMAADVITFFLNGYGAFFPGFTLSAGLGAVLYGLFLYKKPHSWLNVFLAVLSVTFIVNLGFNSVWVKMMTGDAWTVFMGARVIKNIVSLPLNTFLLKSALSLPVVKQFIKKYQF